jgi:type IV fimbrial biogenesis protein FimT
MTVQRRNGFTLIELVITIALLAILIGMALPSFRATIQNNRMTAQANEMVTALQFARSEALKRSAPVTVCASDTSQDPAQCGSDWSAGWLAFVDGQIEGAGSVSIVQRLREWPPTRGDMTISHNGPEDFVRYLADGRADRISYPSSSGNNPPPAWIYQLRIPDCTRDTARDLEVGPTGRIAVTRVECD